MCKNERKKTSVKYHFGSLCELCHLKNAEMEEHLQSYKGRVIFRGDIVRDEDGIYAVFSEQGASASHTAATKVIDAIAHMPGMGGSDADAKAAYTQILLSEAEELLGMNVIPETWITLPRARWPKEWFELEKKHGKGFEPVCPLLRNLYGHPLAGLLWEKGAEKKLLHLGFEKVPQWESLYFHRSKQLLLGVYVDDFHMAGKKENLAPMWKEMDK